MDLNKLFNNDVADFFEKKFSFEKQNDWILPTDICEDDVRWIINPLSNLKSVLNETKSLLNDKGQDWHDHTANINKAAYIISAIKERIQPEILTQAWCKFYEILSSFSLISENSSLRSLHLCEAPGAFVSALNYYLCMKHPYSQWEWIANTLNPYYEGHSIRTVVTDDRLLLPTLKHWHFGDDNTGDITDPNFINSFVQSTDLYDLVTADGSFDCLENPGEQELVVEKLHFSEVLIALSCLAPQGCFILKKFTFFECSTVCQLYLLNCVFEKVCVFKPFTSRPSNSEVYVICIGFQGSDALVNILKKYREIYSTKKTVAVFPLSAIPESFISQIEECMKYFTELQINSIQENLSLYSLENKEIKEELNNLKIKCAEMFIRKYEIYSSSFYDSLKLFKRRKAVPSFDYEPSINMKASYFYAVGDTFNDIKKSSSMQWYDKLIDVENRINTCFPTNKKRKHENFAWQFSWKDIKKRMKSKNLENWITCGKKVSCIQNSKFCCPLLLHLWNKIALDPQVDILLHMKYKNYWYSDASLEAALKEQDSEKCIIVVTPSRNCIENDSLLLHLEQNFDLKSSYLDMDSDLTSNSPPLHFCFVYINTTTWESSLHSECNIKGMLTKLVLSILKTFRGGEMLFLCTQSLLTRYMAGLIYLILSLFDKFSSILPDDIAPAYVGQIWIFKNYQNNQWSCNVLQYLQKINELNLSGKSEVLEIVPISSLCDGPFLTYLRNLNNKHLLQRIKSLITVEKIKHKKQ